MLHIFSKVLYFDLTTLLSPCEPDIVTCAIAVFAHASITQIIDNNFFKLFI